MRVNSVQVSSATAATAFLLLWLFPLPGALALGRGQEVAGVVRYRRAGVISHGEGETYGVSWDAANELPIEGTLVTLLEARSLLLLRFSGLQRFTIIPSFLVFFLFLQELFALFEGESAGVVRHTARLIDLSCVTFILFLFLTLTTAEIPSVLTVR